MASRSMLWNSLICISVSYVGRKKTIRVPVFIIDPLKRNRIVCTIRIIKLVYFFKFFWFQETIRVPSCIIDSLKRNIMVCPIRILKLVHILQVILVKQNNIGFIVHFWSSSAEYNGLHDPYNKTFIFPWVIFVARTDMSSNICYRSAN